MGDSQVSLFSSHPKFILVVASLEDSLAEMYETARVATSANMWQASVRMAVEFTYLERSGGKMT